MPDLQTLLIWTVPVLFAITLHEVAHGLVAYFCGDGSAKMMGRLTLNPMKHIDPVGTVVVPLLLWFFSVGFIFGWAKPVPVNFNALRSPKRDLFWVALAGPGANFLMALGWLFLLIIGNNLNFAFLMMMAAAGIFINLLLAIFNLIPIPPLDGGRVVSSILPQNLARQYDALEPYGLFILIGLLYFGVFQTLVWPVVSSMMGWFAAASGLNLLEIVFHLLS